MKNRKVFNHLHVELSVLARINISRMDLWVAVSEFGDPRHLTKEAALNFLEAQLNRLRDRDQQERLSGSELIGFTQMLEAFQKHDFTRETPEEMLERIAESI